MKGVLLFLGSLVSFVCSVPLYGEDGGYVGYASYVPRKAQSRQGLTHEDSIDTSAGHHDIVRRPTKQHGGPSDSSVSAAGPLPKKYDVLDYVPRRQHGYGGNSISSDEDLSSPYHRTTLYGQSAGGYKIADAYTDQHVDSYSGSEQDHSKDDLSDPQPYEFGYALKDEHGNAQHRHETSDGHGAVKGSYGFMDEHGIYRSVEYVADKDGFRASVKTNEPGVENQDPADVHVEAEKSAEKY